MPPPQKVSYTHDAVIDMIIANPRVSNQQLAAVFGYTGAWMSMIRSSDAFKARLATRRAEIVDPTLTATLEDRIRGITERSLEVIAEKLEAPAASIPDAIALRAAEFGAKALGIGGHKTPPPVDPGYLEALGQRLVALQAQVRREHGQAQDVNFVEHQEAQGAPLPARDSALE